MSKGRPRICASQKLELQLEQTREDPETPGCFPEEATCQQELNPHEQLPQKYFSVMNYAPRLCEPLGQFS